MADLSRRQRDGASDEKEHPNQAKKFAAKIMRGEVALGDPALARDYQVSEQSITQIRLFWHEMIGMH